MDIVSKYSPDDTAYYVIFATSNIYAVTITRVYLQNSEIFYDIQRKSNLYMLENIPEQDLYTLEEAKSKLRTYLETKLDQLDTLVVY